ncbi:MAG: bifunctional phosphoribosyl-AMP cyclohydrolase/phosphoribosyl-ATP diphosphatase HisIE [Lachnospiraceae bacterium]|nr:bifunctional phosphoribosyl-AMP cyclohydrolase/phosphoribosyl-ATP diphosphatase HisIE [Lachnospiraceae bacterium]
MEHTDYKQIIPCIYLNNGLAVKSLEDKTKISEDPVGIACEYANSGADAIMIFDFSANDAGHEKNLSLIKEIRRNIDIPMYGAGNIKRFEDIKKLLYAGCCKAALNFSKQSNIELTKEVSKRFGKDKIAACVRDVSELEEGESEIKNYLGTLILIDEDNIASCVDWIRTNCKENANPVNIDLILLLKEKALHESAALLRQFDIAGIAGGILDRSADYLMNFKRQCKGLGIPVNTYEGSLKWSDLKVNSDGMVPVIVQEYKTGDVLMLAYMNEQAFNKTLESGKMTYFSRSRNELWTKGETSGHWQYVKALYADCDYDTILAKVLQIGNACHTGEYSCFYNEIMRKEYDETNLLKVFEHEYGIILDRRDHPKEGSYTNYLFDKGIDKILKKVGEENTEIIIAAKNPDPEELKYEMADWLYHAMVLMVEKGVTWDEITKEISNR